MVNIRDEYDRRGDHDYISPITIGIVEDVNDPLQLGRIRIRCSSWGDAKLPVESLPFCSYCSPFAGTQANVPRGSEDTVTHGEVAYGQWMIPNVGSRVIVMLIDGNHKRRFWVGSAPNHFFSHTLPHGRYLDEKIPVSSTESPIEPLASNLRTAYDNKLDSAEYHTRGMDRQASAVFAKDIGSLVVASEVADQEDQVLKNPDGTTVERKNGYDENGSSVYSVTTPGFHSLSMDDNAGNCRIKLRTTAGHQIILDDTNERIYVSTAKGNTWIEIDEKGTIDIYAAEDISINTDADLNLTAGKTVRIAGKEGVHITSGKDLRVHTKEDMHIKNDGDLKIHNTNTKIHTDANLEIKNDGNYEQKSAKIAISSDSTYDLNVTAAYNLTVAAYNLTSLGPAISQSPTFTYTGIFNVVGPIASSIGVSAGPVGLLTSGPIAGTTLAVAGASIAAGVMAITGAFTAKGLIYSDSDVVARTTSLNFHTHLYDKPKDALGIFPNSPAATVPSGAGAAVEPLPQQPPTPATEGLPAPAIASIAAASEELPAYFPTRVPQHEPFTRSYILKDKTDLEETGMSTLDLFGALDEMDSILEYPSTDAKAGTGSGARNKDFARSVRWRR